MTIALTYTQIADDLAHRIQTGEHTAGTQMPPYPELATRYGVSRDTIKRAMLILRERRLVVYAEGRGTYVTETLPAEVSTG